MNISSYLYGPRCLLNVLVAMACIFVAAKESRAEDLYFTTEYSYGFRLPDKWTEVPDETLQELRRIVLANPQNSNIIYDVCYHRSKRKDEIMYPFVIAQPIMYSAMGLRRQPSERTFPKIVATLSGTNVEKIINSTLSPELRGEVGNIQVAQPELDTANRKYTWVIDADVKGYGTVRTFVVGVFGSKAMVQLAFSCPLEDVERFEEDRMYILASLHFSGDAEYDEMLESAGGVARSILVAAPVLVAGIVLVVIMRKMKVGK